jgi:hypothetical protein
VYLRADPCSYRGEKGVYAGTRDFTEAMQQCVGVFLRSVVGYRGKMVVFARMVRCSRMDGADELLLMRLRSYDGPVRRRSWVGAEPEQSGRWSLAQTNTMSQLGCESGDVDFVVFHMLHGRRSCLDMVAEQALRCWDLWWAQPQLHIHIHTCMDALATACGTQRRACEDTKASA